MGFFASLRMTLLIVFFLRTVLFAQDSLILGEFTIDKIIDGDTFRFEELDKSTRLLGIDTEEMYKGKDAEMKTNDLRERWHEVYKEKRGTELKPVKTDSPFGYETWLWAEKIFKDVVMVRLEKEDNSRFIDTYGRYLVYVIGIRSDGSEFNYNIECVRKGYSPYFTKYGYSKRFHKEFTEAQLFAKESRAGIWDSTSLCYPDYKERLEWWNRRAEAIRNFETKYKGRPRYYSILDDFDSLKNHVGDQVVVFGSISEMYMDKEPYLIRLPHSAKEHLDLTIFPESEELFEALNIEQLEGEFVYVRGELKNYEGRLEIDLKKRNQLWIE
jgi:endonuclease YncB( thermonuclease family)